jgi:hypothetical protein
MRGPSATSLAELAAKAATPAAKRDTPRFSVGQRVKVIANQGGLYAAQIGVIGVIAKPRQKRLGYRSYDVSYRNAKGAERIVIVREDDLELAPAATKESEAAS